MKRIIIDLDNTICETKDDYSKALPRKDVIKKIKEYKDVGFEIIIHTSRNMRTYKGNVGKINIHTLPIIIEWLERYKIPFDEIVVGKPWCGHEGFYVDDRSIRPNEFCELTHEQINQLISKPTEV